MWMSASLRREHCLSALLVELKARLHLNGILELTGCSPIETPDVGPVPFESRACLSTVFGLHGGSSRTSWIRGFLPQFFIRTH